MMRTHGRNLSIALFTMLLVAWVAVGLAAADVGDCMQQCNDQYAEDSQVCADNYQSAMDEALTERRACFAEASSFMDYITCNAAYESAKSRSGMERIRCDHEAESAALQCNLDCAQSPTDP